MAKRGEKAVSLGEKLRKQQYDAIWKEYCGFLDLTMQDYMKIQNRLMEEQIQLWSDCELGKSILKAGDRPGSTSSVGWYLLPLMRIMRICSSRREVKLFRGIRSSGYRRPGKRTPSDKGSTIHKKYAGYLQEQCSCLPHISYKP